MLPWVPDAAAVAAFVALAVMVTSGLWLAGPSAVTADNSHDHSLFVFFFAHAVDSVIHFHNPLFTTVLNAPLGVNLMANTAFLGMTVPLIPVTLLFGPNIAYTVAVTIGLAGTATAWYVVLRRHVTQHRSIAFASAAFCGFAPGLIGHGNGHPNLAAQFMLPLIVSGVIRLRDSARPVRSGVILGLLIAYQIFLNEELLLLTVLGCGLMVVVYLVSRTQRVWAEAGRFLTGLGVAVGVGVVLTAYPLWFQFFGPQHYRGPFEWAANFRLDLTDYPAWPQHSLAVWLTSAPTVNDNPPESNAFFGWPLLILAAVTGVALWRELAARIAAVVAAVFAVLSLGDPVTLGDQSTGYRGPWGLVSGLPLFDSIIVARLALVVAAAIGVLLAVAGDRILTLAKQSGTSSNRLPRALWYGALAAALLPLVPTPLRADVPPSAPTFFTAGTWRQYVATGSVVPVPPDEWSSDAQRWAVATNLQLRIADGYFLGPWSSDNPTARFGAAPLWTTNMLRSVAATGKTPTVTRDVRSQFVDDLRYWQADALVLGDRPHLDALRAVLDELVGRTGVDVGGIWVWDVRELVRSASTATT